MFMEFRSLRTRKSAPTKITQDNLDGIPRSNRNDSTKNLLQSDVSKSSDYVSTKSDLSSDFPSSNSSPKHLTSDSSVRNSGLGSFNYSSAPSTDLAMMTSPLEQSIEYEDAEEKFLEDHEGYFLHLSVDNVRRDQYPMIETQNITYFDFASSPLYSRSQVQQHMHFLLNDENLPFLGSTGATNKNSYLDNTLAHILDLLKTCQDKYTVIFTEDISSCYRLFGEMFNFQQGSVILTTEDHLSFMQKATSCSMDGVHVKILNIPIKPTEMNICGSDFHKMIRRRGWSDQGCGLLAYPAQSFFSGICHSLNWISGAQQNGWKVLLDVSSCLPMVPVDLSLSQPEFVIGSVYHMLGYPSPVSFLLVRRGSLSIRKGYGDFQFRIRETRMVGRSVHVALESLGSHLFASVLFGLQHLKDVGVLAIQRRTQSLLSWLIQSLKSLRHKVGNKHLVQLYGSLDQKQRGSILVFNLLDDTGSIIPAGIVQQLAWRCNIFLGTTSLNGPNSPDFQVVRVSLGPVSNFGDAFKLVLFLKRFREESFLLSEAVGYMEMER